MGRHLQDVRAVPVHRMPVAASRQVQAGERQGDEADGKRCESHSRSGGPSFPAPRRRSHHPSGLLRPLNKVPGSPQRPAQSGRLVHAVQLKIPSRGEPSGHLLSRLSFTFCALFFLFFFFKSPDVSRQLLDKATRAPTFTAGSSRRRLLLWLCFERFAWTCRSSHHHHHHHHPLPPPQQQQQQQTRTLRTRRSKPAL